jgi:hypothetical protein
VPDFFDSEERTALEKDLRDRYLARSGLTPDDFNKYTSDLLTAIHDLGFDKEAVTAEVSRRTGPTHQSFPILLAPRRISSRKVGSRAAS